MQDILSVGIDIGTSTTQVIFSKLRMENTSGYFSVPHVSIVDKQVVYKSGVYMTPLVNKTQIDTKRVRNIVADEFLKAGFTPADTHTGAVIITGESARKENADRVLSQLSSFAGDFVVSAAGPDLESVIAGKGSGAYQYSMDMHGRVANLDIGGGTTNIVLFEDGSVAAKGCLDIGGRLICVSENMVVEKVSEAAAIIGRAVGVELHTGQKTDEEALKKVTDKMAEMLKRYLLRQADEGTEEDRLLEAVKTPGSSDFGCGWQIDAVCYSGGVGDVVYHPLETLFDYGDIGVLLGRSVIEKGPGSRLKVLASNETIRATVVGAGTYTTTISGSTITYTQDIFPMKNVPVLKLSAEEQAAVFGGRKDVLAEKIKWFMAQSDAQNVILAMEGVGNPDYEALKTAAACLCEAMDACIRPELALLVFVESDIAKALGQLMHRYLSLRRQIVSVDGIHVEDGDYVDMGRPVMDGMVIPVVVKTLIFG